MVDNSRYLIEAAAARRAATLQRAREAIRRLDRNGQPVTFRTVAREAQVSRSWLYREPAIRAEIERLRLAAPGPRLPSAQRATPDSLRQRVESLRDELRDLREENRQLRDQLARRLGHQRTSAT